MLHEHGFGHHGTRAAGTDEPGDCRQQMQEKDGESAHRTILASSRHARNPHDLGIRCRQRSTGSVSDARPALMAAMTAVITLKLEDLHFQIGSRPEDRAVQAFP
jgi:hypothetical protein